VAITEIGAIKDPARRSDILSFIKIVAKENRPLSTPNQLILAVCRAYARRDPHVGLNEDEDAQGAWIVINNPELAGENAQCVAWDFNQERERVFTKFGGELRKALQDGLAHGAERPRSFSAFVSLLAKNENLVYDFVNDIYRRAVDQTLSRRELKPLLESTPYWRMFLLGYAYGIYQQAIQQKAPSKKDPGHLDLWSATYLPACDVFVTHDQRLLGALRILNRYNARPAARIMSWPEWREVLIH